MSVICPRNQNEDYMISADTLYYVCRAISQCISVPYSSLKVIPCSWYGKKNLVNHYIQNLLFLHSNKSREKQTNITLTVTYYTLYVVYIYH